MINSNTEGIECPWCGTWNLHEECGTYEVWVPLCKNCALPTEYDKEEELWGKKNDSTI